MVRSLHEAAAAATLILPPGVDYGMKDVREQTLVTA